MVRMKQFFVLLLVISNLLRVNSQNEASKWYFGGQAGLDFMTNPPTILTNGAMMVTEGCASIADAAGNLLFYTDGVTVYNSSHLVMSNGTGLLGGNTPVQSSIIIKQPGSTTLYYIFTVQGASGTAGLNYSIVDMSLSSGQGSVTVKNSNLYTGYVGEKLTATKHCNGIDYWVVARDWSNTSNQINFRSYLLTTTGVSTTAVISPAWSWTSTITYSYDFGAMKIAPNGKKLGLAVYGNYLWNTGAGFWHSFELWDFDNTTGVVSNSLALSLTPTTTTNYNYGYGVEFSPDGTKFYGSRLYSASNYTGGVSQFNLCAGSPTAIQASEVVVGTYTNFVNYSWFGSLQLAPNGKIYCSNYTNVSNPQAISVINTPNAAGAACGFSLWGQSISPKTAYYGLPNFPSSFFSQPPPVSPFTYTVSNSYGCQGVQFLSPLAPSQTVSACSVNGFSLTNLLWNFGDPASGANNTSTIQNPIHNFNTLGTYTVSLILYYSCGGGTDTLKQVVNVNQPCISVASTSITCANLGSATVQAISGVGPFNYTWMPTAQTTSVATGLSPGSYTITVYDTGNNFTYTASTQFTSLIPLTGSVSVTPSVSCNAAQTGTGSITNLAGGSGSTNVTWYSLTNTLTGAFTNSLSAGIWSLNATDALTGCQINQSFFITQPPPLTLPLSTTAASVCVNGTAQVSGLTSGGTPGLLVPYTYSWTNGAAADSQTLNLTTAGTPVYTLSSQDSLGCIISNTISIQVVPNPTIIVSSASICPLNTGTITASGASTYTWQNTVVGSSYTDAPTANTQYTVIGELSTCTSTASGSINIYPLPNGQITSNTPVCFGKNLIATASGGSAYYWTGPNNFTAAINSISFSAATPSLSGVYNVTVSSAVGCTMTTAVNLTVHPTPSLSASGSTVCTTGTVNLFASSVPGSSYYWNGPQMFSSTQQNPVINSPSVGATGQYSVLIITPLTCTNSTVVDVSVTLQPNPLFWTNAPICADGVLSFSTNGGATYLWQGPNGYFSNTQFSQINQAQSFASGIYSASVMLGPCVANVSQSLTVWPLPVPSISVTPVVCETKTLELFGNSNLAINNWIWAGPGGYSAIGQNQIRTNAVLPYSGVYTLTVTDFNGCSNVSTKTVVIEANPIVTAKGATVCLNAPATLLADGAVTYYWTGPNYYISTAQNPNLSAVSLIENGTYTVVGSAANTCTSVATASILTLDLPQPTVVITPSVYSCPGTTFTLTAKGGKTFEWFGPENIYYKGQVFLFTPIHLGETGTFSVVAKDSIGCKNSNTGLVKLYQLPAGYLESSVKEGCVPYCTDLKFIPISESGNKISAKWEINRTKFPTNFSYCFTSPGIYSFKGILYDSLTRCTNTYTFSQSANGKPEASITIEPKNPEVSMPVNFSAVANSSMSGMALNSTGNYRYTWFIGNAENTSGSGKDFSYLFDNPGEYAVALVVKDQNNCLDTVITAVKVEENFAAYIPNSFTPNKDNLNDYFTPVFRGLRFYTLEVYDRWGKLVYRGSQTDAGWDGSYRGQDSPVGVYTYKLVISSQDGLQRQINGHVSLLR